MGIFIHFDQFPALLYSSRSHSLVKNAYSQKITYALRKEMDVDTLVRYVYLCL